jgi:hypothetical protein
VEESFSTTSSFCHRGQVSPHGREAEGGGAEQLALLLVGRDPIDGGVHVRPQGQQGGHRVVPPVDGREVQGGPAQVVLDVSHCTVGCNLL